MLVLGWAAVFIGIFFVLAYQCASLKVWNCAVIIFLFLLTSLNQFSFGILIVWLGLTLFFIPLNWRWLRHKYFSLPLFRIGKTFTLPISRTEREAIGAGGIGWEAELFRGRPDWNKLLSLPAPQLSDEERNFLDHEVVDLCRMLSDWEITHQHLDLTPATWQFIKERGFFGLIIEKKYGGKEFSAYAHSQIILKLSSISITAAISVAVPNSLGPAELLQHYGTDEQKNHYLPRLARGQEIPCFALTSTSAGSDAGAMTDYGIICDREYNSQIVRGILLNFNKRYITLAPIATVIGLAFKLYDPDKLIGNKFYLGITCALIPRTTSGVEIGRRHFPLNMPFQNGPIVGKNVFIPLEWIIGGSKMAGKGWQMLMECLAAGRGISLPASALGGAKVMAYAAGAYTRIRRQFNYPIGKFEGIIEVLARIAQATYVMDAARSFIVSALDQGEKSAIASAIVKYHVTELGRQVARDGMDIHGGKGICLGPRNYLARAYQAAPIAITVEGANILTRNMIIFGQGLLRAHPYVLLEMESLRLPDEQKALAQFDRTLLAHLAFGISNGIRSLVLGFCSGRLISAPSSKLKHYYQHASRFSAAFAFLVDVCILVYGSSLKRKESISARLGDILSYLYLLSAAFKHYQDQGNKSADLPVIRHTCEYYLYAIQTRFNQILTNLPNRFLAGCLKVIIFPWGLRFAPPTDKMGIKLAKQIMGITATRRRLAGGIFLDPQNPIYPLSLIEDALLQNFKAEAIEKIIITAYKEGRVGGFTLPEWAVAAEQGGFITPAEYTQWQAANAVRDEVLGVDAFSTLDPAIQSGE